MGASEGSRIPSVKARWIADIIEREIQSWLPEQRYLRGLFSGGTFCYQAQQVLQSAGIPVYSNSPLDSRYQLKNPEESLEHSILDLGDDILPRVSLIR